MSMKMASFFRFLVLFILLISAPSFAAIKKSNGWDYALKTNNKTSHHKKSRLISPSFDFPVTYNPQVKKWIRYFQGHGKASFKKWLERSHRYMPFITTELAKNKMPLDLGYVAMVESGFSPTAHSSASAVGIWQFIAPTAERYGLKVNWWIDERKDFVKATGAAIRYKKDLYRMFRSWHLVSASYNTGENRIKRLIKKYKTNSFWDLADRKLIANETINYVPKIIAAALISKSPALYGFRDLRPDLPLRYETIQVPGGTNLVNLAQYLNIKPKHLRDLNPELIKGFIPREISSHWIKVPPGSRALVKKYSALVRKYRKI